MGFRGLVAGLVILLASVSAAGVVAADKGKSSGFLDPAVEAKLKESKLPDGRKFTRWRSPQTTHANYQSIMVGRVIFYPSPNPGPQISSSTLDAIAEHLTYTLRQKIGTKVPVVDKAGPGVLRLQAAITAVTAEPEGMSPTDVLPVMMLFSPRYDRTDFRIPKSGIGIQCRASGHNEPGNAITALHSMLVHESLLNLVELAVDFKTFYCSYLFVISFHSQQQTGIHRFSTNDDRT